MGLEPATEINWIEFMLVPVTGQVWTRAQVPAVSGSRYQLPIPETGQCVVGFTPANIDVSALRQRLT